MKKVSLYLGFMAVVLTLLSLFTSNALALDTGTTVDRTIQDIDSDNHLDYGPGEEYIVREDLTRAKSNRKDGRKPIYDPIVQLSDFQLVDEESTARVEQFDDISAVDTDFDGNVHVANSEKKRILKFEGHGERSPMLNG